MESSKFLYWLNIKQSDGAGGTTIINVDDKSNSRVIPYTDTALLKTVDDKRSGCTRRSYMKAQLARKIQKIIGRPYTKDYTRFLSNTDMIDCPILLANVNTLEYIFGEDETSLQGKKV